MTAEVSVFLFGKPAWEIDELEGGDLNKDLIEKIRAVGKSLAVSLEESAKTLEKLLENGWEGQGGLYDVFLFKEIPLGQARRELAQMGIDPSLAYEFDDEEEPDDETGSEPQPQSTCHAVRGEGFEPSNP